MVRYILTRLKQLTDDREGQFREYVHMLEVLSSNRNLEHVIEQEERMLSRVEHSKLPSFRIGMEKGVEEGLRQGLQQGLQKGEAALLLKLIARRFGDLDESIIERINSAAPEQLELWADNLWAAETLAELFYSH
ncbi:MAG: DUF4351 domain-containing protein [Methylococcales bacterium]|nr:DUF4351 domain-containing protein [Methylococcales bacterium]